MLMCLENDTSVKVSLDFSEVFDMVTHKCLNEKLKYLKINGIKNEMI